MKHIYVMLLIGIFSVFSVFGFTFPWQDKDKFLLEAIQNKQLSTFKKLLEEGANVNTIHGNKAQDWVMCLATERGNIDFLELAIQYGGDINLRNRIKPIRIHTSTPILCAINSHNMTAFNFLLDKGVDLSIHVYEGATPVPNDPSFDPVTIGKIFYGSPLSKTLSVGEYCMTQKIIQNKELNWEEKYRLKSGLERGNPDPQSSRGICHREVIKILNESGYDINPEPIRKKRLEMKAELIKNKVEPELKTQREE